MKALLSLALASSLLTGGCFESERGERFYGRAVAPSEQVFRWSDGGLPSVFDPARAAAPPDTDAVRALFEGLTDYEPATLRPVPSVASRWEPSEGGRVWVFHLRRDARWSNGDAVTAGDFVRSWQRSLRLGEGSPHSKLLANIEGARAFAPPRPNGEETVPGAEEQQPAAVAPPFGAVALDAHTLRVRLERPDRNFPALVAHTVFRPVHELSPGADLPALREEQEQPGAAGGVTGLVTNGAFSLSKLGGDSVVLERAKNYWDAASVSLERVHFVDKGDTESALAAYRAGEVDAVTNSTFEPLAVKLLTPYEDFRRETFGALNYYRFNTARPPFDDRRVREALTLALDLERLSADTLGGATEPARRFLPGASEADLPNSEALIGQNAERARTLLAEAGFPGGENFPRVRLLVNRNEQQRLIAQTVARMWRSALGIEAEVIVKDWEEYEAMLRAGDFDVARRSIVLQTTDEETNMLALFGDPVPTSADDDEAAAGASPSPTSPATPAEPGAAPSESPADPARRPPILTEEEALRELPAIPLYFASSYALVKPYVEGFEPNLLDAHSLKRVRLNTAWKPPEGANQSRSARVFTP
ncbi:MAG TPA: peptide ABC transporter substrate-binding protein [Pyrinomonadaceae bacterium]|nr:peptide ABC transporter substrate-binding protein [Pyrinomonadaceae bacterium]